LELKIKDLTAYENEIKRLNDLVGIKTREAEDWKNRFAQADVAAR